MAATAEAPQMAKPVAMSRERLGDTPIRRPSHCVPKKVAPTVAATTTNVGPPSWRTSATASWNPSRTTPKRSRRLAAK